MHAYFIKDIYIYKLSHFNFYYFYFTPYLIYNHNTTSRTKDPEKVFGLQHLHLKNYFKTENYEPNGLSEYYKFYMLMSAVCTSLYKNLYINGFKTVYEKIEFLLRKPFLKTVLKTISAVETVSASENCSKN